MVSGFGVSALSQMCPVEVNSSQVEQASKQASNQTMSNHTNMTAANNNKQNPDSQPCKRTNKSAHTHTHTDTHIHIITHTHTQTCTRTNTLTTMMQTHLGFLAQAEVHSSFGTPQARDRTKLFPPNPQHRTSGMNAITAQP